MTGFRLAGRCRGVPQAPDGCPQVAGTGSRGSAGVGEGGDPLPGPGDRLGLMASSRRSSSVCGGRRGPGGRRRSGRGRSVLGSALARSPSRAISFSEQSRICAVIATVIQAWPLSNSCDGKRLIPVSFPVRLRPWHGPGGRRQGRRSSPASLSSSPACWSPTAGSGSRPRARTNRVSFFTVKTAGLTGANSRRSRVRIE